MRDSASLKIEELIEIGFEMNASDLMLKAHQKPMFKRNSPNVELV